MAKGLNVVVFVVGNNECVAAMDAIKKSFSVIFAEMTRLPRWVL